MVGEKTHFGGTDEEGEGLRDQKIRRRGGGIPSAMHAKNRKIFYQLSGKRCEWKSFSL